MTPPTEPTDNIKRYYLQFKKADGTWEIIGPYRRKAKAVMVYKKMYLEEYGVPCPTVF